MSALSSKLSPYPKTRQEKIFPFKSPILIKSGGAHHDVIMMSF
jgi:hypothetical protein